MIKFVRNALLACALCLVPSVWAEDFMGLPIEDGVSKDERALPTWMFGGGASLAYYLKTLDGNIGVDAEYRLHRNHSIGLFATLPFMAEYLELGLDTRWYFRGSLMRSGHDDFLKFAASAFYMDHDGACFSPTISFGYGRDILFFKNADFLGRFEFYGSYVVGEPVEKQNERLPIVEPARFFLFFKLSLFFF